MASIQLRSSGWSDAIDADAISGWDGTLIKVCWVKWSRTEQLGTAGICKALEISKTRNVGAKSCTTESCINIDNLCPVDPAIAICVRWRVIRLSRYVSACIYQFLCNAIPAAIFVTIPFLVHAAELNPRVIRKVNVEGPL